MTERVLVFNVGSTTLKYAVIDPASGERFSTGLIDRIGQPGGDAEDHLSAAKEVMRSDDVRSVTAIGHRIVQGGSVFTDPTPVTAEVLAKLPSLDALAPLHNPSARSVVEAIAKLFPHFPQTLVFDTAFYSTLAPSAYRYAVDEQLYLKHGVRRYGMHGTSHQYVTELLLDIVGSHREIFRCISLHLGGGASATASLGGFAVETSMGMTPLEGLVMATRCGDIDPAIISHLVHQAGMTLEQVDQSLIKKSGLLGLCGDADMRKVLARCESGDERAQLAVDVTIHRLKKYVGAYAAILGGVDALVFTAGIGENSPEIRRRVTDGLEFLGIEIDTTKNQSAVRTTEPTNISAPRSRVQTWVIPTNEELAIARAAAR